MWAGALAFLLPFALYIATRAPDLTFIDSGELAAAAATLGIPHPTGYPLYTLLGRALCALPGPLAPITRLTLFSAAAGAGAAALVYATGRRLLAATGLPRPAATAGGLAAGLLLAAGRTVWGQAVIVEVYALHLLLVAALLHLALRATTEERGGIGDSGIGDSGGGDGDGQGHEGRGHGGHQRHLLLLAYGAGLTVGNHLSTIFLLPVLAIWILRAGGSAALRRDGLRLALAFLAGASIYAYLPLRSALDPPLDWGDPAENLGAFYRHATGAVYRVWFLSGTAVAGKQLVRFIELLTVEMTPLALLPAAAGLVILWRRARRAAEATTLLFLLNVAYAINYDIHDIDSYFLPAFLVLALWAGTGIGAAFAALVARGGATARRAPAVAAAALAVPVIAIAWNFRAADQHTNHLVPDYTAAMFASLEPGAVILSRQWDHFCSAAIYEQLVRERRHDVTIVEKELLRRRWYLRQLGRWDPELTAGCRDLIAEFDAALIPFEAKRAVDGEALQALYVEMINCLLARAAATRPTYLTPDALEPGIARDWTPVPAGLAMRLYRELPPEPPPAPEPPPLDTVRDLAAAFASGIPLREQLAGLVLEMEARRAIYLYETGDPAAAIAALDRVLARVPAYTNATRVRNAMRAESENARAPRGPAGSGGTTGSGGATGGGTSGGGGTTGSGGAAGGSGGGGPDRRTGREP